MIVLRFMPRIPLAVLLAAGGLSCQPARQPETPSVETSDAMSIDPFVDLVTKRSLSARRASLARVRATWQPGYAPILIEAMSLIGPELQLEVMEVLIEGVGDNHGPGMDRWRQWLWSQEVEPHPGYATFKAKVYQQIDPRFAAYFHPDRKATIRLDEIRWGGVHQDGIPPLRRPLMIAAGDAAYLADSDVVFGVAIGDDVRAYPKRILAWHEMFVDDIGGVPLCGVYCTLCGSMILYETTHAEVEHELGTSGFLYRSNKLMYDRATQSLWNTLQGRPVLGPLVGRGIELKQRSVVTSTWGEWRRRHPGTQVLSLKTGHRRDYAEGAAYRDYFATDNLMFNVPRIDSRLKNKDEVLALRFPDRGTNTLAIASSFLRDHPVYLDELDGQAFVVLTDASGAHRVYDMAGQTWADWNGRDRVSDGDGNLWDVDEEALRSPSDVLARRLPSHNAFWFGWYAAYPGTRLVP